MVPYRYVKNGIIYEENWQLRYRQRLKMWSNQMLQMPVTLTQPQGKQATRIQPEKMIQQNKLHYTFLHKPNDDLYAGRIMPQTFGNMT